MNRIGVILLVEDNPDEVDLALQASQGGFGCPGGVLRAPSACLEKNCG